jgi:hypothetical protein
VQLADAGVQVLVATHSLFFMRAVHLLLESEFEHLGGRYIGLDRRGPHVTVRQGDAIEDSGKIVALEEDLRQSDLALRLGG